MARVTGLVLAAGLGCRFGSDKRLARLQDGRTLLSASLACWHGSLDSVRVVLRGHDAVLAQQLQQQFPGLEVTLNPDWQQGMGTSLAAGARACHAESAVLIGLADMPWLSADTLASLACELRRAVAVEPRAILRPRHAQQPGHPVGFGPAWLPQLHQLDGDEGARALIRTGQAHLRWWPCSDPGCVRDVDYPADLAASSASTQTNRAGSSCASPSKR